LSDSKSILAARKADQQALAPPSTSI